MNTIDWPRRNPFNKRWFQRQVGATITKERSARVADLIALWEPRLFAEGVNVPECLGRELARLVGLRDGVDWEMFPNWVKGVK
jgi:hypothetical protein